MDASLLFAAIYTCVLQKQTSSTAEKSFAVGTLAEVIESIGETTVTFVDTLYPVFLRMVKDEDAEVRSNAIFALGMLATNGGDKMKVYVWNTHFYRGGGGGGVLLGSGQFDL